MVAIFMMAKKKTGRARAFPLRGVRVTPRMSLGTLASQTVLVAALVPTSDAQYRLMSVNTTWSLVNFTAADGPVTVGYAHNDYTIAEIKECLEETSDISPGDKIAQEQANRWVRVVGTLGGAGRSTLNDGQPVKTRLNWAIQIGSAVNIFAYNESAGGLTTGGIIDCVGKAWVKDY